MRARTATGRVDELEAEGARGAEGLADLQQGSVFSEALATAPRPGTSLRNPNTAATALRRPGTEKRPGTEGRVGTRATATAARSRTARTPGTARALLATAQARAVRLGTGVVKDLQEHAVVNVVRLDLARCAQDTHVAKPMFEYLFYYEGDYRHALELAVLASQACSFTDWWWKVAMGRCYGLLGLARDSERQLRTALAAQRRPDTALRLARACCRLDQPLAAKDVCQLTERSFPGDVGLLTEQARILEALGELTQSVKLYRSVSTVDAMNTEAMAAIAVHHFYNDQPELALRYYRRVLAMGAYSAEVFNNVALCCLRAQHWDLTLACFRRAQMLAAEPQERASLWYNLSHLALTIGDVNLAMQCLRLCLGEDPSHGAALNNLAALEARRVGTGPRGLPARLLAAALSAQPGLTEAKANLAAMEAN